MRSRTARVMTTLMRNGRDRRSENPDTRQRHGNDRVRTLMVGTPRLFGRHYVRCSSLALARQYEPFVALLRDFGAFPTVAANPFQAEIRQETARFAGNVSSHVPGVGSGHQSRVNDLSDMRDPLVLSFCRRLDCLQLVSAHVSDAVSNPLNMLFDRHRHI